MKIEIHRAGAEIRKSTFDMPHGLDKPAYPVGTTKFQVLHQDDVRLKMLLMMNRHARLAAIFDLASPSCRFSTRSVWRFSRIRERLSSAIVQCHDRWALPRKQRYAIGVRTSAGGTIDWNTKPTIQQHSRRARKGSFEFSARVWVQVAGHENYTFEYCTSPQFVARKT